MALLSIVSFFIETHERALKVKAMLARSSDRAPSNAPDGASGNIPLTALEVEAIELFINFLRLMDIPKSVGEIYGLLFVSPHPVAMDELMQRLKLSAGAASGGLKLLRSFGAVKVVYQPGARRDYYVADLELSKFATAFLKEEINPRMERALERLKHMEELTRAMDPVTREATVVKIERLKHWLDKGNKMLPWITRFLVS